MKFEMNNLISEFEMLKSKLDDVITTHVWHGDDMYTKYELKTKDEMMLYAIGYTQNRIQHQQTTDLLQMYINKFNDLIEEFKSIEKASSDECLATDSDNA